jgi:hypothetical protein
MIVFENKLHYTAITFVSSKCFKTTGSRELVIVHVQFIGIPLMASTKS